MNKASWLIRRLKAMSIPEVLWRISQRVIQNREKRIFERDKIAVTSKVFNQKLSALTPKPEKLHINLNNKRYGLETEIHLLAGANYKEYKNNWNAGFQTENKWPEKFSYNLEYKHESIIGDARTNWELNRHFQFALLAKNYYASGKEEYYSELEQLFCDWVRNNPFLFGISWTSVMEIAIRCSNWCITYAFLDGAGCSTYILEELKNGILNMTDYVLKHYSRYSSANNHLIVEAFAIGQSGFLFDNKEWIEFSIKILSRELNKQNYSDGVNKELSLHYQSFYMEAMGLTMRLMEKNGVEVPSSWGKMLSKMSKYVSDCIGDYGEVVVFGDDDEGKILDLQGGDINHYKYVLSMMSILLDEKYIDLDREISETILWLFSEAEFREATNKDLYISPLCCCYRSGGNTILRSKDRKVLIGIDHAALGFGRLAAHGHSDALSFQMFFEGERIFIDPGTYLYHYDLNSRNEFRKTINHNTVTINEKDQSEMLGAFLWGRKAKAVLEGIEEKNGIIKIIISHDGYKPVKHTREIIFDGDRELQIYDELSKPQNAKVIFNITGDVIPEIQKDRITIKKGLNTVLLSIPSAVIVQGEGASRYGEKEEIFQIISEFKSSILSKVKIIGGTT